MDSDDEDDIDQPEKLSKVVKFKCWNYVTFYVNSVTLT